MNLFLDRLMVCKAVLEENIPLVKLIRLALSTVIETTEVNGEKKLAASSPAVSWALRIVNPPIGLGTLEIFAMVKPVRLAESVEAMIPLSISR